MGTYFFVIVFRLGLLEEKQKWNLGHFLWVTRFAPIAQFSPRSPLTTLPRYRANLLQNVTSYSHQTREMILGLHKVTSYNK